MFTKIRNDKITNEVKYIDGVLPLRPSRFEGYRLFIVYASVSDNKSSESYN
jgi:hypothetical protein